MIKKSMEQEQDHHMQNWDNWIESMTRDDGEFEQGLKHQDWIHRRGSLGETALIKATKNPRVSPNKLDQLIQAGASVNEVDPMVFEDKRSKKERTYSEALMSACETEQVQKAKILIKAGASTYSGPWGAKSPLIWACEKDNRALIELLLEPRSIIKITKATLFYMNVYKKAMKKK